MSRPLRIESTDALFHVTSRGDRREDIYLDDTDRSTWLDVLAHTCDRFNWVVQAYCLMGNHYHLMVQTPDANLAAGMRQLNGVYTQRVNRGHGRVGHVFQGRYKAVMVDAQAYLLELARYVVLNPVRAGMVADAAAWPWSSYRAMVGAAEPAAWLDVDALLAQFAPQRDAAVAAYVDHVRAGVGLPSIWSQLTRQVFLGDDAFASRMVAGASGLPDVLEVPRAQRRQAAAPIETFTALPLPRHQAMAQAYATGRYSMAAIARAFGVHYATVSRAVARSPAAAVESAAR
jgi:putative transposase